MEHCGRSNGGQYVHTLSAVDIASGWWEGEAISSRSQQVTKEGMEAIRARVPFRIREIHPDNDSGMVNDLLWRYCKAARIKMSRSRPYKKNDNAWVEQRNWTHVRKVVGYQRLDTTGELRLLRELYAQLRLYKNFFQPAMKLTAKTRVGGKIHRKYDRPRTPYQRPVESRQLTAAAEEQLRQQYEVLSVVKLRHQIEQLRNRLFELVNGLLSCYARLTEGLVPSASEPAPSQRSSNLLRRARLPRNIGFTLRKELEASARRLLFHLTKRPAFGYRVK